MQMTDLFVQLENNGSPSRSLLSLLQEQALSQVKVQPWCT